ncbi:hypothetical protein TrVFT333_007244 [Trichoderma virens FT-333]|nr:hypothetical protein TrVFT333_007244 [Trichoderma virens FT-333]
MATGFDRLERLFSSKRKASSASATVATSTSPQQSLSFPLLLSFARQPLRLAAVLSTHYAYLLSSARACYPSLLTLTPPPTSRPATAAAFEAARIAKRYDFDLVYVVNLWPGGPREQVFGLESASSCERPLVGRLLAAHGLHQVPSPLQIALNVHTTILRSKGWVEYRNPEAQSHELARGYACSFYTGKYSQGGSVDRDSPVSGVRLSEMIDRGIVFAAYRKPRIGPCRLGHTFTGEELSSLYEDAETLVEMLIDIHARNRQCQPDSYSQLCDETGPMPQQELDQVSS